MAIIEFPPFRIDLEAQQLLRGSESLHVRGKAWAVLRYLAERPDRLVTKSELLEAIWPDAEVGEENVGAVVRELRNILGDETTPRRFIETVAGRGYRFIGAIRPGSGVGAQGSGIGSISAPHPRPPTPALVGRDAELAQLSAAWQSALAGHSQVVLVSGEAGIGKTALVDEFISSLVGRDSSLGKNGSTRKAPASHERQTTGDVLIGHGQCVEQHGAVEGFLPWLDILQRWCGGADGAVVQAVLRDYAPAWLPQLSAVLSPDEQRVLASDSAGVSGSRMVGMCVDALHGLAQQSPLLIVLEDLHWSDAATLDVLTRLAYRRGPARILVLATYRAFDSPTDCVSPAATDLVVHRRAAQLRLAPLTAVAVLQYVDRYYPGANRGSEFAPWLWQRSTGNPLFMHVVLDHLRASGTLHESDGSWQVAAGCAQLQIPAALLKLIDAQVERLGDKQQKILAAAAVGGSQFTAPLVAAGLGLDLIDAEEECAALAKRGQFIRTLGVAQWPDGTIAGRYELAHALFQEALYQRSLPAWREQTHRRIAGRLESLWGEQVAEAAAELATHYRACGDTDKTIHYLQTAARTAQARAAHREAVASLNEALQLAAAKPAGLQRSGQELALYMALATSLNSVNGMQHASTESAFARARELSQELGQLPQILPALWGLWSHACATARHATAMELATQGLRLAQQLPEALPSAQAQRALMITHLWMGHLEVAAQHEAEALALVDADEYAGRVSPFDPDLSGAFGAQIDWLRGFADRARTKAGQAVARSRHHGRVHAQASTLIFAASIALQCGDSEQGRQWATEALHIADDYEVERFRGRANCLLGSALVLDGKLAEGLEQMEAGMRMWEATGLVIHVSALLVVLAESLQMAGRTEEAIARLARAHTLIEQSGERWYEAELWRVCGDILQRGEVTGLPNTADAESYFERAIAIARSQGALALELRATTPLARLWIAQGKDVQARDRLATVYGCFTEGFDSADLRTAGELLDALQLDQVTESQGSHVRM